MYKENVDDLAEQNFIEMRDKSASRIRIPCIALLAQIVFLTLAAALLTYMYVTHAS